MELYQIRTENKAPSASSKPAPYQASTSSFEQALEKVHAMLDKKVRSNPKEPFALFVDWTNGSWVQPAVFGIVTGKDPQTGELRYSEAVSVNPVTLQKPGMVDTMIKNLRYPYMAEIRHTPEHTILFSFPDLLEALKEHYGQMYNTMQANKNVWKEPKRMVVDIVKADEEGRRQPVVRLEGKFSPDTPFSLAIMPSESASEQEKAAMAEFAKSVHAISSQELKTDSEPDLEKAASENTETEKTEAEKTETE